MSNDLLLRRKWTLRAHGQQVVFVKKPVESTKHVLMKAFIWALYLPQYPALRVEVPIGDRYKPDIIQLDDRTGAPLFWGEAGQVGKQKIRSMTRRFRGTHFAMGKWDTSLKSHVNLVEKSVKDLKRSAPFDLIRFPADSAEKFITPDGQIEIDFDKLEWIRIE